MCHVSVFLVCSGAYKKYQTFIFVILSEGPELLFLTFYKSPPNRQKHCHLKVSYVFILLSTEKSVMTVTLIRLEVPFLWVVQDYLLVCISHFIKLIHGYIAFTLLECIALISRHLMTVQCPSFQTSVMCYMYECFICCGPPILWAYSVL